MIARTLDLETLTLAPGGHDAEDGRFCFNEAAAWLAGEPWTARPACMSPVIASFTMTWNDTPDPYGPAIRDRLKAYLPRVIGTRGTPDVEERRAWLALDWLLRVHLPAWLRLAGLTEHADALAGLPPQMSLEVLASSAAAWDAARDAAWAAASAAASAATSAATRDAAWAAASAATRDAAWAATRAAAWAAAWAAAREDATSAATWAAASAAAWAAARAVLHPTVEALQASAWELLDRMIDAA